MRILHLRSAEFFGGPERAILGQCRNLKGHYLACAAFVKSEESNALLDKCRENNIDVFKIRQSSVIDFSVIGKIRKILVDNKFDIIVTHDYKANFFAYYAVKKTRTRQISHFRGRTAEDFKVRLYNSIDWFMLRRISRIIVVSEVSGQILIDMGVSPDKITVLFNAIELDEEAYNVKDREYNGDRPIKVVAAGRFSHEKGYDVLVKAVSAIHEKAPEFIIEIYGNGPDLDKIKEMAKSLKVEHIVKFMGFVDDIKPVFASADFMILPSRSEGMPNVVLEAWARRLGVISTAVGGVPNMFEHDKFGLLAEPDNPDNLGEKLLYALQNINVMYEYGRKGFEKVSTEYSYEKQGELLNEIYAG